MIDRFFEFHKGSDFMRGTVVKYFSEKGFGFIQSVNGSEIFFHISTFPQIPSTDILGSYVDYDTIQTPKGLQAVKIKIISNNLFIDFDDTRIKQSNIAEYGISSEYYYEIPAYKIENDYSKKSFLLIFDDKERKYTLKLSKWITIDASLYTLLTPPFDACFYANLKFYDPHNIISPYLVFYKQKIIVLDGKNNYELFKKLTAENANDFDYETDTWITLVNFDTTSSTPRKKETPSEYLYVKTFQKDNFRFYQENVSFNIHEKIHEIDELMKKSV